MGVSDTLLRPPGETRADPGGVGVPRGRVEVSD